MSRLEKTIKNITKAAGQDKSRYLPGSAPSFNEKGGVIRPGLKKTIRRISIIVGILAFILLFLYLPQVFMKEESLVVKGDLKFDPTAITLINDARTSDWAGDFDGDGLDNQEELNLLTDPYHIDTDGDSITDYAEVYVTKTNPTSFNDNVLSNKKLEDEINGTHLQTPYKVGNVILWADDYSSKAYGSVVETPLGYRICNFSGYAQFPLYEGWYAYKIEDGIHTKLEFLEDEKVWRVAGYETIELFPYELQEKIQFTFFGRTLVVDQNTVTSILAKILPDRGLIAAEALTDADLAYRTPEAVMTDIQETKVAEKDMERFKYSSFQLSDIMMVRDSIDSGECINVTIYHENLGEKRGIIFGYYKDYNTMLVADPDTLEYVGNIYITEKARMMIIDTGETVSYEYFDFEGFGASSAAGFKINFFK